MAARLDYRWHLRQVMATRSMFSTTDLLGPLSDRGIKLSSSQVYRLVVEPARAPQPEDPHGAAGHPGLRHGRPHRTRRRCRVCQENQGIWRRGRRRRPAAQAGADRAGRLVTAPAEALADPAGTVVSLVTAADPALGRNLVRRIIEQVGGGRSKRRRLAAGLRGDPSVLTTGQSPASKVVGDLMLALRAAGATGISPPWCADCGRRVTSMQRRGEYWYCAPCFVRPEVCAGCGNTRQVAFRDRRGRPRCSKCPDKDARDPLLALVEVIVMIDPACRPKRPPRRSRRPSPSRLTCRNWPGCCMTNPGCSPGTVPRRHSRWC